MSNTEEGKAAPQQADAVGPLVHAARKGDLGAFNELVKLYQRRANAVAFRLLNNVDDAMEIVQDAFLRAYDRLGTLSHPEQFGPWLMRIVSNLALNRRRARALRLAGSIDAGGGEDDAGIEVADPHSQSPVEAVSAKELEADLAKAIDQLPDVQRKALVLFSMAEIPQKEVAKMLDCSVEAVKWHVFMARKKLKDRFKDYL